jgi:hypothetical protein
MHKKVEMGMLRLVVIAIAFVLQMTETAPVLAGFPFRSQDMHAAIFEPLDR